MRSHRGSKSKASRNICSYSKKINREYIQETVHSTKDAEIQRQTDLATTKSTT